MTVSRCNISSFINTITVKQISLFDCNSVYDRESLTVTVYIQYYSERDQSLCNSVYTNMMYDSYSHSHSHKQPFLESLFSDP